MNYKNNSKIKFYCFYYEGIKVPVVVEARSKNEARYTLRSIRNGLPDDYKTSHVVGETVKSPVTGISKKTVNGVKYVWVGEEFAKDGWMDEKKYNQ